MQINKLSSATLAAAAAELREAFPDPWIRQYSVKANDVAGVIGPSNTCW